MVVLNNSVFKRAVVDYLEYKSEDDLATILKSCDFIVTDTGQFSYRIWNQSTIELEIRAPIPLMKQIEENWDKIVGYCKKVYPEDEDHLLKNVLLKMRISNDQPIIDEDGTEVIKESSIYNNLIAKVHKSHLDSIEKDYILEGCSCAIHGNRLAAATMIGCAAERLLLQLSEAYLKFMRNSNASEREIAKFENEVVNAKKAHARLDGFLGKVRNAEEMFKGIGLENSNLHFSFLDIVRQVRNESGHPTGIKISEEDLSTIFGNYQLLIDRVHPVILKLPTLVMSEEE